MKATTCLSMHRLSIIAMMTFLFSFGLDAQGVVIKEKVTINMMEGRKDLQKLTALSWMDDYPSCIPLPESYGTCEDICGNVGFFHTYIPFWYGDFTGITTPPVCCGGFIGCFDNDACTNFEVTEGTEYVRVIRESDGANVGNQFVICPWKNPDRYILLFDQREPDTTAWVTVTVTNNGYCYMPGQLTYIVVRPQFSISVSSVEEIRYGEQADIFAEALNQCGGTSPGLPNTVTYNMSIESGMQYGVLKNTSTNDSGSILQGLPHEEGTLNSVVFIANGMIPDSIVEVRIKVNTSDPRIQPGELSIKINPGCLAITIAPDKMAPGDTVNIILENKLPNGTRVPYPADQIFNIWMNTDEQYGRLRCISNNDEGSYVYGQQPFEFIAADDIDTDSIVVAIEASLSSGGIAGSIVGTLGMPAGLMLKMQASKSELGITGSTRAAIMERNTARSYEKLRKRLNAIREKAKNKSQFDKIIAKVEARLASTNEVTNNTIVAQKSLAKSGSIAMSVEEGEHCELPIADVTIKKECTICEPLNKMTTFDQSNIEPRWLDNGPGCDNKSRGGYTFPDGTNKQMYNFCDGTIYATSFKVFIDWSICNKNMPPSAVQINCNLSNVNSSNAQDVVDVLTIALEFAESQKIPIPWIYFNYIPVCAIEAHELSHVEDLKAKLSPYYDEIVKRINKIEPIRDWCKLSPTELLIAQFHKLGEAGTIQQEIYERIKNEVDDDKDFGSNTERKADQTENAKINQVIDGIKLKFNIQ